MQEGFEERRRALFARRRWIIAAILSGALVFTGFFIYRSIDRARDWRTRQDEPIKGWMTVGHIARSRGISPGPLKEAIGLDAEAREQRPLARIARDQGRSPDDLILTLEKAIAEERLKNPTPDPGGRP